MSSSDRKAIEARIVKLYDGGLTIREISQHVPLKKSQVAEILRDRGVKLRPRGPRLKFERV